VYRIRTRITAQGSTIQAEDGTMVGYRHRQSRTLRWETPDEDIAYGADALDRAIVAKDQIRLIVRTFRDRLFTDLFPGRTEVPKTLVFAKDDSHAEDVVEIIREEFGRGNAFCQKITYKTTGKKPADLIQEFRNSYEPRIAVTVDMIATGTDIRPVEVVVFLRSIKSRVLFEQMKGRGVRVIDPTELKAVTPDAHAKTHFVIVDCIGITETPLADTYPLERNKSIPFKALLEHVAMGGSDPDVLSSLASRLARLAKECGPDEHTRIREASGGTGLTQIAHGIVDALDPDLQHARARSTHGLTGDQEPTQMQLKQAAQALAKEAAEPLATRPGLRQLLQDIKRELEQVIDEVSRDALLFAGASAEAQDKAKALVASFEQFIADNKDEIDALQFFFTVPHRDRLRYDDIKALAATIKAPPRSWTPEVLSRAYELLEKDKVRRVGQSAAHRYRVPRAFRAPPGQRAGAPRRARAREVRELDDAAGDPRKPLHGAANPLAGDDARPRRDVPGDRRRGLRRRAIRAGGGPRTRGPGVRAGVGAVAQGVECGLSSMNESGAPKGWAIAPLGDICVEKVEHREPGESAVPYIDIGSIDRDTNAVGELQQVTRANAPTRARQSVRAGDVLVSMTRPNLNAVALVPRHLDGAIASTGFDVLRPMEVLPEWIFNRVRCHDFVADMSEGLQGVVYPAIRPHDVRKHKCPIPPLPEQKRIVEVTESHFTRLDDAVATLKRVQRNLKRYRASVLKAAVEGRLVPTEAELARAEGREYEPVSVLLKRILSERRGRGHEAGGRGNYPEPVAPDTTDLPDLPEGWCWATVDAVGDVLLARRRALNTGGSFAPTCASPTFATIESISIGSSRCLSTSYTPNTTISVLAISL